MLASPQKRRLTKPWEWVNNWKIHGSVSSLLCPFSYQGNISQNEWTSLIIHDRRSGKFECTSALNKLRIREEWAIFGPPALIKLLGATSLAPKWQNHGRNIKNEWFIYGLSTKLNIQILRSRRTIPLHLKIAKKRPFFVWKLTLGATFWKPVTKSSKPRTEYVKMLFP